MTDGKPFSTLLDDKIQELQDSFVDMAIAMTFPEDWAPQGIPLFDR